MADRADIGQRIRVVPPQETFGSWSAFVMQAAKATNPLTNFGARFASLVDKLHMSPHDCLIYVARRVGEAKLARDRAWWFGGRMHNSMTGNDPDYVQLSGAVIANSLAWLGEDVPEDFPRGADLEVQFEIAAKLDQDLRAKAAAEGTQG